MAFFMKLSTDFTRALTAERSYRSFGRYGETKLANILFTSELAQQCAVQGRSAEAHS
jgi:hypothetical protein